MFATPKTEQELLTRANDLAGHRLADLAKLAGVQMPKDLRRHKGWPGQLIELLLGATAGSKPVPDFQHLGIELKTLPIDQRGKPLETTFVCAAPLTSFNGVTWQTSHVRNKMACVLWVPLIAERSIPLAERQVASPFLWRPDEEEDWLLRQDWEELTELIVLGQYQSISAKHGQVMQLRPKAANSSVTTSAFDQNGKPIKTLPLGFYLKTQFTQHLVNKYLIVN